MKKKHFETSHSPYIFPSNTKQNKLTTVLKTKNSKKFRKNIPLLLMNIMLQIKKTQMFGECM